MGSGAGEIPQVLFQFFFMIAGVVGGVRLVDDIQRWRANRATESVDA